MKGQPHETRPRRGAMARRITVRAPVRIDLAGGWTDVPPYPERMGGEVVNFAIDQYITAEFLVDDDDRVSVSYSSGVANSSGLGTSAALNVAFLAAISGEGRSPAEIAELAYRFEALLGNRGGRQDQWAAALGGFQHLFFIGTSVEHLPLDPPTSVQRWLHRQLVVANTGRSRLSGSLIQSVFDRFDAGEVTVMQGLGLLRQAARDMSTALQQDQRHDIISALHMVGEGVELLSPELHAPYREVVAPLVAAGDVLAWKGCGAGGGGHVALLAGHGRIDAVRAASEAAGWPVLDWDYDTEGVVRIVEEP